MKIIDKIAFIYLKDGKILSTLSKGKDTYYIPGGKREGREKDEETLIRECKEELNINVKVDSIKYYGTFEAQAHGKSEGVLVKMTCYMADFTGKIEANSEIQEVRWLDYNDLDIISPVDKLIFKDLYEKKFIDKVDELKLVIPTKEYEEQVMECRKIFLENKETFDGCAGLEDVNSYEEWCDFDNRLAKKYGESYVESTVYLGIRVSDNKLVGIIDFMHSLSDFLFNYGGNIGYSVIPSERRKGYAKEMLRLIIDKCEECNYGRLLLTCDKENVASAKTIIANGGVLENEVIDNVNLSKSGVIQRYWISLKKHFSDRVKDRANVDKVEQNMANITDDAFKGDIYLNNFIKINKPCIVGNGVCIQDNNYKWIEFYDYECKVRLTAIYNENNEIVEWYFDIARKLGKENNIPYEDDLYLDVVLRPNGEISLLDEEEMNQAYQRKEMTKEEYDEAYRVANGLIDKIKGNENRVKNFTDKYLKYMLNL